MGWHVVLRGVDGQEYDSASLATRQGALSFACNVLRDGEIQIVEIANEAADRIDLDEVALFCQASKLARAGRGRV